MYIKSEKGIHQELIKEEKRYIYDLKVTVQWLVRQGGRGAEVNYR